MSESAEVKFIPEDPEESSDYNQYDPTFHFK